jgi:DNA modification methylase
MRIPILNNSAKGEGVYDPFCGSGTTLLACEKEGRKAYCVELSEEYCSTIIKRWELLSGEEAQLLGNLYCD